MVLREGFKIQTVAQHACDTTKCAKCDEAIKEHSFYGKCKGCGQQCIEELDAANVAREKAQKVYQVQAPTPEEARKQYADYVQKEVAAGHEPLPLVYGKVFHGEPSMMTTEEFLSTHSPIMHGSTEKERAYLMATGAPLEVKRGIGTVFELNIPKSRALSEEEIYSKGLPKEAITRAYTVAKEDLMG